MELNKKKEKIERFDLNGLAIHTGVFGMPFNYGEAELVILPVPWEVSVSYVAGTAKAPMAIKRASFQVDLFDALDSAAWEAGVFMLDEDVDIKSDSIRLRLKAEKYIEQLSNGSIDMDIQEELNKGSRTLNEWVQTKSLELLNDDKKVIVLGGDHSVPLGYLKALATKHKKFGILQIDAHADLRNSFEGFEHSHASIMYNALKINEVEHIVQVGIRDYCHEEVALMESLKNRVSIFFDKDIKRQLYNGVYWNTICDEIVEKLPQKVYVSFDIDGLDPKLCPNTGTPVAGGFEIEEVLFLIEKIQDSGRELIGMDLCEVATGETEWDANVAARLLYRLCNLLNRKKNEG